MKHVFIINPKAGKKSSSRELTERIRQCFAHRREDEYEIFTTQSAEEATRVARSFAEAGEPVRVFACGGDGTAFDVLNGVAGHDNVTMGVIPCGTGNDFLKYFDTPSAFASVEAQLDGEEILLDAIRAGDHYCMNQASMGMDAHVCVHKNKFSRLPLINGQTAYILSLFYCFFSAIRNRLTVQVDDQPAATGDYLFAIAANGQYYGGGFRSAPRAVVDDGLLDCVTIDSVSRLKIVSLLKKYTDGEHLELPICHYSRGKSVTVTADKDTPVNLDGEVIYAKKIVFEILPRFVRFLLPKGCRPFAPKEEKVPVTVC